MKPESLSLSLLGITRSKAKMHEYNIPYQYHIAITREPAKLLSLTVGIIGDFARIESPEKSLQYLKENKKDVLFAAQFFDAYLQSNLATSINEYLTLIGSASYYLVDLPGSCKVLSKQLNVSTIDLGAKGLEKFLCWLLKGDFDHLEEIEDITYREFLNQLSDQVRVFSETGENEHQIIERLSDFRKEIYATENDRVLLFSDIIISIIKKRIYNSSWTSLRRFSDQPIQSWTPTIIKNTFIREFWPSQRLLGEKGIFRGISAIIQMPTSAGKTKSTEIIIRSSFLSDRSNLAVIVAPFRALCSEIKKDLQIAFSNESVTIDEPSDALQNDFDDFDDYDFESNKVVLILTPEKLMYILRTVPELADQIGLLIYDEGHQFDNGIRGITYELLLSTLKRLVNPHTQFILISAVISNANVVGDWLIPTEKEVIEGKDLFPTYRTTAFVSWTTMLGQLQFVDSQNPEVSEYFVPRILEQHNLNLFGRERTQRRFPIKDNGPDVALFLATKLVRNGACAIFCGSKQTVKTIYKRIVDIQKRGFNLNHIREYSDDTEIQKLIHLHSLHFGENDEIVKAAELGLFTHSGHTPNGLRGAIEYAMQSGLIKIIVCTSTLAQGVNLPIKYLLITSFYQAGQRIKTRDFHNLIGRAGRSGIYTEGSIIFTDTELYDKKNVRKQNWKWRLAKNILDPQNSEPCGSTLLSIFDPLLSDDGFYKIDINPLDFVDSYLGNPEEIETLAEDFSRDHRSQNFSKSGLARQINFRIQIIASVESFMMANWENFELNIEDNLINLAKETLAYSVCNEEQQVQLTTLFKILGNNVETKIPLDNEKQAYGRTLFGARDILEIKEWTNTNLALLLSASSEDELLSIIWEIIYKKNDSILKKIITKELAFELIKFWVGGNSYISILNSLLRLGAKMQMGSKSRNPTIQDLVDICEGSFSYEVTLVLSAIIEIIGLEFLIDEEEQEYLISLLKCLQKRIKYGLPTDLSISFFEIGFDDRNIAIDLTENFSEFPSSKEMLKLNIFAEKQQLEEFLTVYPSYFTNILNSF